MIAIEKLKIELSGLTDKEFLERYENMQKKEEIDYMMDGSGDCGEMIAKSWEPVWEAFEEEFEKRDIEVSEPEMPY